MRYIISGMPTSEASYFRGGGVDAYGNIPETGTSDGSGVPCRHCLQMVPKGEGYLIFAYRPFGALQPYAETGPVFLCQRDCTAPPKDTLPGVLRASPDYLIKGYTPDERIKYGTGAIVAQDQITATFSALLRDDALAFVDVRSAKNNCWLARITRP